MTLAHKSVNVDSMNTESKKSNKSGLSVDKSPSPIQIDEKKFSFDKSFQEKIIVAMIYDRVWASQFSEVLNVNYFEYAHLKKLSSIYVNYYNKYKEFPTIELLAQIVADDLKNINDSNLKEQIKFFLRYVAEFTEFGDLAYVKEKSLDFCKRAGLQKALEESVDLINTERYEKIVEIVKTAINAGTEHTSGLTLTEDVDARYSETYRRTVPTGIDQLDQRSILNGGLGGGEIGVVVAPSGVGKSHMLTHLGASALLKGKNVLHYTFELNERAIGIRYDSHLIGVNSTDCYMHKEAIKKYYSDNAETLGRLIIKYFPTGSATVNTLRAHIEKLSHNGFRPDILVVDYAGIMRSTEKYELLRLELKKIFEELRGFAAELDIPVWTAAQSNKEGMNSDFVDMSNMAEAYAQAHIADVILGLSRKSANKATGYGNIFIAKNRAGIDGIKFEVHLDTAQSRLRILTDEEVMKMKSGNVSEEDEIKNLLRMKLRSFQKASPVVKLDETAEIVLSVSEDQKH